MQVEFVLLGSDFLFFVLFRFFRLALSLSPLMQSRILSNSERESRTVKKRKSRRLVCFPSSLFFLLLSVRLTLAAAGVNWTDVASQKFGELKATNALPWGHFPLLLVDGGSETGGHNLSNSIALQWYVCGEEAPELIPKSPLEQHWALSTSLTTEDRFVSFVKWAFAPSDAKVC